MTLQNYKYGMDADGSIFFDRELETIMAQSFDVLNSPLSSRRLIQAKQTADPADLFLTYNVFENTGIAKIMANNATDYPVVNVTGRQVTHKIVILGDMLRYSIFDIEASRKANKSLDSTLITNARMEHERAMNKLVFDGAAEYGITGWLDNPDIPIQASLSATPWSAATGDQMLNDLNEPIRAIRTSTNGVHEPNTIVLPIEQYGLAQTTRLMDQVTTVLEQFLNTNPGVRVTYAHELAGRFGGNDGMVIYNDDQNMIWEEVPLGFRLEPAQMIGMHINVYAHSRHGGVIIPYPKSQAFRTGI